MNETERVLRRMFRSDQREPPPWLLPRFELRFEFRPGPLGNYWQNIELEASLYHRLLSCLHYEPELDRAWVRFANRWGGAAGGPLAFAKRQGGENHSQWSSHGRDHCLDQEFFVTEWEQDSSTCWLLSLPFSRREFAFTSEFGEDRLFDPGVLVGILESIHHQPTLFGPLPSIEDEWEWDCGWNSRRTGKKLTQDFVFTCDERRRGDGQHVWVDEHKRGYSPYTGAMFDLWT